MDAEEAKSGLALSEGVGTPVDNISIEIDYAIMQHFSEHLYGSPNKAIEELVSNGFDAFASKVYVYLPGRFTSRSVLVWDDGDSMDVGDLKKLWWIARSPKDVGERIAESGDGRKRAMIERSASASSQVTPWATASRTCVGGVMPSSTWRWITEKCRPWRKARTARSTKWRSTSWTRPKRGSS